MVKVIKQGVYYKNSKIEKESQAFMTSDKKEKAIKNTLSYSILKAHGDKAITFDSLLSDAGELTYNYEILSGVLSLGLDGFTVPYTIVAGGQEVTSARTEFEAVKKFGGDFVPAGVAGASFYLSESKAKCGEMILTSFGVSAGASGAMCVSGSNYDFLAQFLRMPYALDNKEIVGVFMKGKLRRGVGAVDAGLSFLKAFENVDATDKIFEFCGPGVSNLSMESRIVIDNIVRETGCFATVWETESAAPKQPAFYDGGVGFDLTRIEPMISVTDDIVHPEDTKIFTVEEFLNFEKLPCKPDLLARNEDGDVCLNGGLIDGIIGGTFENIAEFAEILRGEKVKGDYRVCPVSRSVYKALAEGGYLALLCDEDVSVGEVAAANGSYDFVTACAVAGRDAVLRLDARTLAVSALEGGKLTSALEYRKEVRRLRKYTVNNDSYSSVYRGAGKPDKNMQTLDFTDAFPVQERLPENLIMKFACVYGATEQRDWSYPEADGEGRYFDGSEQIAKTLGGFTPAANTRYSYAAASVYPDDVCDVICDEKMIAVCIAKETYSDAEIKMLVNDGVVPLLAEKINFKMDELLYIEGIAEAIKRKEGRVVAKLVAKRKTRDAVLCFAPLTEEQRKILLAGGFLEYYKKKRK